MKICNLTAATMMIPAAAVQAATIVHLTDLHAGGAETADLVQVIAKAEQEKADLTVVTGDLVNCGMQTYLDYDKPEISDYDVAGVILRKNWFVLPGNHEYAWAGYAATAQFEKRAGPRHGIREIGGWRFIGVDFGVPYSHDTFIDPAELQWLENALREAKDAPCVLCLHQPPFTACGDSCLNQDRLTPLLQKYPVRLILTGHTHKNRLYLTHGIPVVVTAATLSGWYSVVTIQDRKVELVTKNVLQPETAPFTCSLYDAQGRLDPQGVIKKGEDAPEKITTPAPTAYAVYKVEDAAVYVPPVRMKECLYFANSLGHCWELRLPPAGRKFTPERFRQSLRQIGEFTGTKAFVFFTAKGQPCFLSDHGQLQLPRETIDLNRTISCQPIVRKETLIIGTLTGTVLFFDLKNRRLRQEIDLHTALAVESLAADENGIYICSLDETLCSLGWDGAVRWCTRLSGKNYSFSVFPSAPLVHENRIFITSNDNKVAAFATGDGAKIWEQELEQCSTFTPLLLDHSEPALARVVAGNRQGILAAFDPQSGAKTVLWNSSKHQILTGVIQDETMVLNCGNGAVVQSDGKAVREWAYALPEQYTRHAPIPLSEEILLPCWNGTFLSFPR